MVERSLLVLIIILLIGFISAHFLKTRIPNFIHSTFTEYNKQIDRLISFQEKRKTSKVKFTASKKEKKEVYVIVIGESLNKYNMGIYGHFRDTTPKQLEQVQKDNLQVFTNVYANAGNTMQALSLALTEANQYNKKDFLESLSFIDIFNKAGFDTFWISSQNVLGESNTLVSVLSQSSKHIIDATHSIKVRTGVKSAFDGNVIEELEKHLSQNKNTLFIIHLYGNHFKYADRYPEPFSKYEKAKPFMLGTKNNKILDYYSAYDNSVYYNDYVLSSILDVIKNNGGVSCFLHFSDHGEEIARNNGHTSRPGSFTYEMSQIPFTAWLSPEYIKRYPDTYKTFISHKDKLFSNDMVYNTILGLSHIKTDRYDAKYDLSSLKYNLEPKNAKILHSTLNYTAPNNYHYWQKYNTNLLAEINIDNKIVIVDTDSVGKLNDAWKLGFRSFKFNLSYDASKEYFQTGTKKYDTQGNFIDLLNYFNINEMQNVFLSLTNVSPDNQEVLLSRLEYINNQLGIKQKTVLLIEELELIKVFQNNGWKVASLTRNTGQTLQKDSYSLDYSLLDAKTYNKMRKHDKVNNTIINHTFNLANNKLNKKLQNMKYLKDDKINFLFVSLTSTYDK